MNHLTVLRTPGDVIAAVPALLGFHPSDSLVAVWCSLEDRSVICTVRLDLDTPEDEVTRRFLDLAAKTGPGRFILVAYPTTLASWIDSERERQVLGCAESLQGAGLEVSDLLVVAEGRWWSMLCTDRTCCPMSGTPVGDITTVIEAELVGDGRLAVAETREQVAARYALRPDLAPSEQDLALAETSLPATLAGACRRVLAILRSTEPLTAVERAEAALLLDDVTVRDFVIAHLATDPPERGAAEALVQIALTTTDDLRPRVAGAAAAVTYANGDSTVAVWSLLDHARDDSLGQLVAAGIDTCMPPTVLKEVFADALLIIEQRIQSEDTAVA